MKEKIKAIFAKNATRYVMSSLFAFAINFVSVLLIDRLLENVTLGMEIAMVGGWLISSHINFFVNRSFVFRSRDRVLPAYLKYYTLALPVFLVKCLGFVELLCRLLSLPVVLSLPIAELMMFVLTYIVQKKIVFNIRKKK